MELFWQKCAFSVRIFFEKQGQENNMSQVSSSFKEMEWKTRCYAESVTLQRIMG